MRIGHGFDVHPFSENIPLVLGGIHIPYKYGLLAHSNGDVVIHSIIDAMLGAAVLGDIGTMFPDNNQAYKGINSMELLQITYSKVINKGYRVENIDVTVVAQKPKIAYYITQMRICIAKHINCNLENISIKATTTQGLGFIGNNEGIACIASVLLL